MRDRGLLLPLFVTIYSAGCKGKICQVYNESLGNTTATECTLGCCGPQKSFCCTLSYRTIGLASGFLMLLITITLLCLIKRHVIRNRRKRETTGTVIRTFTRDNPGIETVNDIPPAYTPVAAENFQPPPYDWNGSSTFMQSSQQSQTLDTKWTESPPPYDVINRTNDQR